MTSNNTLPPLSPTLPVPVQMADLMAMLNRLPPNYASTLPWSQLELTKTTASSFILPPNFQLLGFHPGFPVRAITYNIPLRQPAGQPTPPSSPNLRKRPAEKQEDYSLHRAISKLAEAKGAHEYCVAEQEFREIMKTTAGDVNGKGSGCEGPAAKKLRE